MNSFHSELKFFDYTVKLSIHRSITVTITMMDGNVRNVLAYDKVINDCMI